MYQIIYDNVTLTLIPKTIGIKNITEPFKQIEHIIEQ